MEDGILKRCYEDTEGHSTWLQLLVLLSLRDEVLHELHAGALEGHLGEEKTLHKVKECFYWPGMQRSDTLWCHTCEVCQTRMSAPQKNHAPLGTIKAGYPMQVVAVDIMGPLPESEAGNSFVLVAGDYFTKWTELYGSLTRRLPPSLRSSQTNCSADFTTCCTLIRGGSLNHN